MEQIRSFIAIELPDDLKEGLAQLQANLKEGIEPPVKWVNPYGIHLTLKFLGNVAVINIDKITRAMEKAAQGISPFELKTKELGVFPNLKRVQVIWVGIGGEMDRLNQFQKRIELNLAPLGFSRESRPFVPHLTLCRVRDWISPDERQIFGQRITDTKFEAVYTIKVDSISLIKSQLTREGAIYSQISSVECKTCQ